MESVFFVDVDGDGANELFIAWTWATGAGPEGAVDLLEVCGWRWDGSQPIFLKELSGDLSRLGMADAAAVTAFVAKGQGAGGEWQEVQPQEHPQTQERTRVTQVGEVALTMTQTGSYFVRIEVSSEPSTQEAELVGMTHYDTDHGGQRTWDFTNSWELRTIQGEADCCAFDLRAAADGAPRITEAWVQGQSTYVVLRQEQSKVEQACKILWVTGGAIATESLDCEEFIEQRRAGPR